MSEVNTITYKSVKDMTLEELISFLHQELHDYDDGSIKVTNQDELKRWSYWVVGWGNGRSQNTYSLEEIVSDLAGICPGEYPFLNGESLHKKDLNVYGVEVDNMVKKEQLRWIKFDKLNLPDIEVLVRKDQELLVGSVYLIDGDEEEIIVCEGDSKVDETGITLINPEYYIPTHELKLLPVLTGDENNNVIEGSNVFEDIGLPNPEEYLAKAKLIELINGESKNRNMKKKDVAKTLGISKKLVKEMFNGSLSKFSLEQLRVFLSLIENKESD